MKPRYYYEPTEAIAHLRGSDPILDAAIERVGKFELELKPIRTLFEALLRSIVYQQLHGAAARAIHGRVEAVLKRQGGVRAEVLLVVPEAELRGAGLSAGKLLAARALAEKCREGVVPSLREAHKLTDEELLLRLTQVRGIGPWTVHMLMIFYLGRPDVLPTGDFSIRQAFKRLYRKRRDPTPAAIILHAKRWRPYRSVASWYLWRSLDLE